MGILRVGNFLLDPSDWIHSGCRFLIMSSDGRKSRELFNKGTNPIHEESFSWPSYRYLIQFCSWPFLVICFSHAKCIHYISLLQSFFFYLCRHQLLKLKSHLNHNMMSETQTMFQNSNNLQIRQIISRSYEPVKPPKGMFLKANVGWVWETFPFHM